MPQGYLRGRDLFGAMKYQGLESNTTLAYIRHLGIIGIVSVQIRSDLNMP